MDQCCSLRVATILGRARLLAVALVASVAMSSTEAMAQPGGMAAHRAFNVVPILIQNVTVVDGQLTAFGLAGSRPFATPITLSTEAPAPGAVQAAAACPILNLSLGPINLDLLGLNVATSPICLDITAVPGSGALLGNLLCGIANLLDGGLSQSEALAALTPAQRTRLGSGLTQLLNQAVFIPMTSSEALQAATCEVLSLSLGPIDLNLLGLRVELDNCSNGPVTVDIDADPAGGLLGRLLCGLANLLNGGDPNAVTLLRYIASLIGAILT